MYPDLSYFFHEIIGTAPDNWTSIFKTFGLMLALALVAAGTVLRNELVRLESEGKIAPVEMKVRTTDISLKDVVINSLLALFIGAKLPYVFSHFSEFQSNPAGVIFSGKGVWLIGLLVGVIAAVYLYNQLRKAGPSKEEVVMVNPSDKTSDIVILAGVSGVAGAKLFSVFENLPAFFNDPIGTFFSGNGLNVYGGVLLAFFIVYRYVKKLNINPKYVMDIGGMGILVGYAVGRMGCQFSGDGDWGIVAAAQPEWWFLPDWLWAYDFPNNVAQSGGLIDGCSKEAYTAAYSPGISEEQRCASACGVKYCHQLTQGVYPTSVYEIFLWLGGFGILWLLRKRIQIAGVLFFMYMVYNGIVRYLIEEIRVNDKYELMGMNGSQAQYISLLFILIGIIGIVYLVRKHKNAAISK